MDVSPLIAKEIDQNRIRELYLYQLSELKTVDNWNKVKEIGRIEFKGKHANYNGAVVQYGETYYFVKEATLSALEKFRKWDFKGRLTVVTEDDIKKKK